MTRRVAVSALVTGLLLLPQTVSAQRIQRRIYVTGIDATGAPALDLTAADFDLLENGFPREVTRLTRGGPMRIVLLVDSSAAIAPQLLHIRAGLKAFLEALPGDHEIALISTGGQLRIRAQPTAEREKVRAAAASFASDGGANAFLDSLIESDRRFLKSSSRDGIGAHPKNFSGGRSNDAFF
jgi:hypothetical protein